MKSELLAFLSLVFLANPLSAVVLVDNTAQTPENNVIVDSTSWHGIQFTTDSSGSYYVDSVAYMITGVGSSSDLIARIYSDNSNTPNAVIGSFLDPGTSTTGPVSNVTLNAIGSIALEADTSYWISLGATSGSYGWAWGTDSGDSLDGPGVIEERYTESFNAGSSWSGGTTNEQYLFQVNVTAVPEPSTYAAIFGGLALFGTLIARRRKS